MSLQWVQVDQGGLVRGRMLGRLLEIGDHGGIGLAVTYWAWALEMAPVDPHGVPDLRGLVSDFEAVLVGVGWAAQDADKLQRALILSGLFQLDPMRVRGLSRYRPYFDKKVKDAKRQRNNRKNRHADVARHPRDVAETSKDVARRGDKRRREEIRQDPPPLEEEATASAAGATSPPPPPPTGKLLDSTADVYASWESFYGEVEVHRSENRLKPEQRPGTEKLQTWWSEVATELAADVELIGPAYLQYLTDEYWGQARPQWPFHGFIAQWRNYVPNRTKAATR